MKNCVMVLDGPKTVDKKRIRAEKRAFLDVF